MNEREAHLVHENARLTELLGKNTAVALHHERKMQLALNALKKEKYKAAAALLENHLDCFKLFDGDLLHDSIPSSS